jgi:hypothetical protein
MVVVDEKGVFIASRIIMSGNKRPKTWYKRQELRAEKSQQL